MQRAGKFQAQQVTALAVGDPNQSRFQAANRLRGNRVGRQWRYRDLKRKAGRTRQTAPGRQQDASGTDVKSGSKFQEILPVLVDPTNKNWYRQGEALVLSSLGRGLGHRRVPVRLGAHHVPNTKKPVTNLEIGDKNFGLSYLRMKVKPVYNKIWGRIISKCGNLLRLSRKLLAPIIDFILLFS